VEGIGNPGKACVSKMRKKRLGGEEQGSLNNREAKAGSSDTNHTGV